MLRENLVPHDFHLVPHDFLGFLSFSFSCFRHETFAYYRGPSVSQSGNLRVVQSGGMGADSRVTTAARRLRAQVEETSVKEQGPAFLVLALKGSERLDLRVSPRKTRDHDSMEEEEVSQVLADNVPGPVGKTANFI